MIFVPVNLFAYILQFVDGFTEMFSSFLGTGNTNVKKGFGFLESLERGKYK